MIDYLKIAQEYHGSRNDGFLTDAPMSAKSSDGIEVRREVRYRYTGHYDAPNFRWIPSRPSGIVYPKAKELIEQFRREYAERLR